MVDVAVWSVYYYDVSRIRK